MVIMSTFVLCVSPMDYYENKVFLDLYHAILATVFLDVELNSAILNTGYNESPLC